MRKNIMRIGMFTDCYRPVVNGVVTSIEATINYLQRQGHKVYLIAPHGDKTYSYGHTELRFASFTFPFHKEQRVAIPLPWGRFKTIGDLDLDLIHVHTPFAIGLMGRYWSYKKQIPLVYTHHTHFEEYIHYIPLPKKVLKRLAVEWPRNFCKKCDTIIAPSKAIKSVLETYGIKKPVFVWPSPIDVSCYKDGNPNEVFRRFPEWSKKIRLLYVGRLGKEKGLDFLIKSMKILRNKKIDAGLLVVGDGPYRKVVEEMVESHYLTDSVWFAGLVERENVRHYYKAAELFVFSSVTETQGLVIAEALASGCPVVAVDAPGVNETFVDGNGGWLVQAEPALFAYKIAELLNNPKELVRQSGLAVTQANRFSWDVLGAQLEQLYENMINRTQKQLVS